MKGMNNICSINQKWVREPSPDPPEPNHCGTAVQKSLEAGGLKVSEKKQSLSGFSFYYVRPYLPSSAYQVIKNNNPNGYEIYKKK